MDFNEVSPKDYPIFEESTDAKLRQKSYSTILRICEKTRRDPEWLAVSHESIYRRISEGLVNFYPALGTLNIENFQAQTLHVLKLNIRIDQKEIATKITIVKYPSSN